MSKQKDALIIGARVIRSSSAYYLARRGVLVHRRAGVDWHAGIGKGLGDRRVSTVHACRRCSRSVEFGQPEPVE